MVDTTRQRTGTRFPPLPHPDNYPNNRDWATQLIASLNERFQQAGPVGEEMVQDLAITARKLAESAVYTTSIQNEAIVTEKFALNATFSAKQVISADTVYLPQVPTSTRLVDVNIDITSSKSDVLMWCTHTHQLPKHRYYVLLDDATALNSNTVPNLLEHFTSSANTSHLVMWRFANITPGTHSIAIAAGVPSGITAFEHKSIARVLYTAILKNPP